jgi:predicted DNA-binding ribbon-helix-helix protein
MASTRRTQLLMDPAEYRRLQAIARKRKVSVADLIRSAVREVYLEPAPNREAIVEAILAMRLPKLDWDSVRSEIEEMHADLS